MAILVAMINYPDKSKIRKEGFIFPTAQDIRAGKSAAGG